MYEKPSRAEWIDDPADPRLAPYLDIRERDLVGREGKFVAEGEVVLRCVVREGGAVRLDSVLLADRRVAGLADVIADLPAATPVYVAPRAVLDAVAGFPLHRGILAIGARAPEPEPEALLRALGPRAMVLALFGISNHDNMGGVFRNAAAFGAGAVLLDPTCCDPLYRKAIRVSVGAALTVPFVRLPRDRDPLDLLTAHGFTALALSPSGGTRLSDLIRPERAAVLLGSEGPGLPEAILKRARAVSIPMAGRFDSLNVAVTAGVVLHQLAFS